MAKGFFVPSSLSGSFVESQRNPGGDYKYDTAVSEVGLNQQAALQSLNKQYSTTINNAYTNYLAASRGVRGATMGEGYKQAYIQKSQEDLATNIAETNLTAASARAQLGAESSQMLGQINKQFQTEVGNLDRVSHSLNTYLGYIKSLSGKTDASARYLTEEQSGQTLDKLYDVLLGAQPQALVDANGHIGMSYMEWVNANLKDTAADREWSQWLFGQGGDSQFREMIKKGIQPL